MRKDISPIFYALADQYLNGGFLVAKDNPKEFKRVVKNALFTYVGTSLESYFESPPFLSFNLDNIDKNSGVVSFRENIRDFLKSRKIVAVKCKKLDEVEGMLIPKKGGFSVLINNGYIRLMRTSLAHEVGHTYFYDITVDPPNPIVKKADLESKYFYGEWERLAFEIGRELLLPQKYFETHASEFNSISLNNFLKMYDKFKVSKDVLARRIFWDLKLWNAYLFLGYFKEEDIVVANKNKFRIQNGKFKCFNLKDAIRNNSLEIILYDKKDMKKTTLEAIIKNMDVVHGKKITYKKGNLTEICNIDIGDYVRRDDGVISFSALLY